MQREKREILILLRLEPHMMENGLAVLEMDMEFKSGLMVLNMRASGKIIELMAKVNLLILMVISMMENG